MFFFQNLTAELIIHESPDDSYFPKSGGSNFLKTVGSHFSEIYGNKVTAYNRIIKLSVIHQSYRFGRYYMNAFHIRSIDTQTIRWRQAASYCRRPPP